MSYEEPRYDAGYRESLLHTIDHINNRIREEKKTHHLWHDEIEHGAYIQALEDVKSYLIWIIRANEHNI